MTTQHSTAPWRVSGYDSHNGTPAKISGAGGEPIADLYRLNPDNNANARLIAAAPDLLTALLELVQRAEHEGGNLEGLPEYDQAYAAIAAATQEAR